MEPPPTRNPGHPHAATSHISFKFHTHKPSNAVLGYEYFISLPPTYSQDPTREWPLLLSLHGAGGSQHAAGESYVSLRHGIPKIVLCYDRLHDGSRPDSPPSLDIPVTPRMQRAGNGPDRSQEPVSEEVCRLVAEEFINVIPSLNMGIYKSLERAAKRKLPELRKNLYGYGWNTEALSALLDEVTRHWRVDVERIHVTGFSMGGYGTWALGLQCPERFASLVPMCGGGEVEHAGLIAGVPQWIHHGELDEVVPLSESLAMVEAMRAAGRGAELRISRYAELNHDCWTDAYNDPEVYRWMLRERRRRIGDETAGDFVEEDKT